MHTGVCVELGSPCFAELELTITSGMNCGIVQTGRLDPVISFGSVSSHVHKIAGGSSK